MTPSSAPRPSRRTALAAIVILLCTCLVSVVTAAPKNGKKKGNSQYTDYIERFAPLAVATTSPSPLCIWIPAPP